MQSLVHLNDSWFYLIRAYFHPDLIYLKYCIYQMQEGGVKSLKCYMCIMLRLLIAHSLVAATHTLG